MYDKSQTTSIFTAAQSGLQTSLQYLLQNNKDGISRTALNTAIYNNGIGNTSPFFQMISTQFTNYDKNNDGVISVEEAGDMLNSAGTGLTRDQVLQLQYSGSIDKDLANKILSNFAKIDANGDGKVSEAEINQYCISEDVQEKQDEKQKLVLKNMSCFYEVDVDDDKTSSSSST